MSTPPGFQTYGPRPGTHAFRAFAYLDQHPEGEAKLSDIAQALGVDVTTLSPSLQPALDHGALLWRTKNGMAKPRYYRLAGKSTKTPQGDQPRFERGREGMEPQACESASGRGTDGAPALVTLPQYASPGGGLMGTWHPAAAGPPASRSAPKPPARPTATPTPAPAAAGGAVAQAEQFLAGSYLKANQADEDFEFFVSVRCRSVQEIERVTQFVRQMREAA